jgi:hypothetical protein
MAAATKKTPTQVTYISADDEPVATTLGEVDPMRVVRGLPVRIPVSRAGQRNYSGWYWSSTIQRHLVYESLLERDRLLLADFCPTVRQIAAQPFWVRGYDGSRFRRHVPDIMLEHLDGSFTVVDVKAEMMLSKPEVGAVLTWTDRLCRQRGWGYEVWSGVDALELRNVRFLSMAKRSRFVDQEARAQVVNVVRDGMSINEILSASQSGASVSRSVVMPAVLEQLWLSNWVVDLRAPLSGSSVVTATGSAT